MDADERRKPLEKIRMTRGKKKNIKSRFLVVFQNVPCYFHFRVLKKKVKFH